MSFKVTRKNPTKSDVALGCLIGLAFILFALVLMAGFAAIFGFIAMLIWNNVIAPNTGLDAYPFVVFFGVFLLLGLVRIFIGNGGVSGSVSK